MSNNWERFAPTAPPEVVVAHPVSVTNQRLMDIVARKRKVYIIIPITEKIFLLIGPVAASSYKSVISLSSRHSAFRGKAFLPAHHSILAPGMEARKNAQLIS